MERTRKYYLWWLRNSDRVSLALGAVLVVLVIVATQGDQWEFIALPTCFAFVATLACWSRAPRCEACGEKHLARVGGLTLLKFDERGDARIAFYKCMQCGEESSWKMHGFRGTPFAIGFKLPDQ